MKRNIHKTIIAACALAGFAVIGSGCMVVHDHPPGSPNDGYVYHHEVGLELVYVSSIGMYRVSGYPNVYYYSGNFYRDRGGYWETKSKWRGNWKRGNPHGVPPGLAKKR